MSEYDPRLVEFTEKLAALMDEYGAEFEVLEETSNWETYASGLSIEVGSSGEYEGARYVEVDTKFVYPNDIRKSLK